MNFPKMVPRQKIRKESEDIPSKYELASRSYAEVLDATQHQDDKIGRLLAATAFLTSGSLALLGYRSSDTLTMPWAFRGANIGPLVLYFAVGYITLALLSASLLLSCLMTPLVIPSKSTSGSGDKKSERDQGASEIKSQIYFKEIARRSRDDWMESWQRTSRDLAKEHVENLLMESHNLAVRVDHKYSRTNEAVAILQLALLLLIMLGVASLWALSHSRSCAGSPGACTIDLSRDHGSYWILVAVPALWVAMTPTLRALSATMSPEARVPALQMFAGLLLGAATLTAAYYLNRSGSMTPGHVAAWVLSLALSTAGAAALWSSSSSSRRSKRWRTHGHNASIALGWTVAALGLAMGGDSGRTVAATLSPASLLAWPVALSLDSLIDPLLGQLGQQQDLANGQNTQDN